MSLKEKRIFRSFTYFGIIGAFLLLFRASVYPSAKNIEVYGSLISVNCSEAPIVEILESISEKTGMTINSSDPLEERVTLIVRNLPIEEFLKRLLANRDYILVFREEGKDAIIPSNLVIIGQGPSSLIGSPESTPPPNHSDVKRLNKRVFNHLLAEFRKKTSQINAETVAEGAYKGSILVRTLSLNSLLDQIGLCEGDIVIGVNGKLVRSLEEVVDTLGTSSSPGGNSLIMIDRMNTEGERGFVYAEITDR